MSLGNMTYGTVVDTVKNWIKTNCTNISNYSGMSTGIKSGYNYTVSTYSIAIETQTTVYTETAKGTMTNSLAEVSSSVVDTDMNNYLYQIGIYNRLSENISINNLYKFIDDIVIFCCSRVYFITNQTSNTNSSTIRYRIYKTGTVNYKNTSIIGSSQNFLLVEAAPTKLFLDNLINYIKSNIRVESCKYTYTVS